MANRISIKKPEDINDILDSAISDEIVDNSRWSIIHEIVIPWEGKFYKTTYSVGATESQDESPWEYKDEIELTEVHQVEKLVKVWENV